MFLVAARVCTVTVLLTAAAVRAEEARNPLPPTPSSDEVAAAPWLRCEPAPISPMPEDAWDLRIAGRSMYPQTLSSGAPPPHISYRDRQPPANRLREIERVPLVLFWESRSTAMFLGVNRHGIGGVHIERKSSRERAEGGRVRALFRTNWRAADPSRP